MLGSTRLDWGAWAYGLLHAVVGGGANAVVSALSVSIADPKDFAIGSGKFLSVVGTSFLIGCTISFFMFLKQDPTPPMKRESLDK